MIYVRQIKTISISKLKVQVVHKLIKANAYIWGSHKRDDKQREKEEADEWDSSHDQLWGDAKELK